MQAVRFWAGGLLWAVVAGSCGHSGSLPARDAAAPVGDADSRPGADDGAGSADSRRQEVAGFDVAAVRDTASSACIRPGCGFVMLAEGHDRPLAIVVAGDRVYWSDIGSANIWSIPTSGGSAELVLADETVYGLASDETHLYFTGLASGRVGRVRLGVWGGPAETLLLSRSGAGPANLFGITVTSAHLYVTNATDSGVFRLPKVGGPIETVMPGRDLNATTLALIQVGEIVSDGQQAAWYFYGDGLPSPPFHALMRANLVGGRAEAVLDSSYVSGVALHAGELYFADQVRGTVYHVSRGPVAVAEPLAKSAGPPGDAGVFDPREQFFLGSLAADERHLYWLEVWQSSNSNQRTGKLMRVPLSGGPAEVLYESTQFDQRLGGRVALAPDAVYLTVTAAGRVMRLPK